MSMSNYIQHMQEYEGAVISLMRTLSEEQRKVFLNNLYDDLPEIYTGTPEQTIRKMVVKWQLFQK